MPQFTYMATDSKHNVVTGTTEQTDRAGVIAALTKQGTKFANTTCFLSIAQNFAQCFRDGFMIGGHDTIFLTQARGVGKAKAKYLRAHHDLPP